MRAICKVCGNKDTCSYIKLNKEGDCIDVQTSDYGYQEAVEKALEWLRECLPNIEYITNSSALRLNKNEFIKQFKKEMKE